MRYGQVKVTLINLEEYADFNINRLRVAKGVGLIHKQIFSIGNKIVQLMHLTWRSGVRFTSNNVFHKCFCFISCHFSCHFILSYLVLSCLALSHLIFVHLLMICTTFCADKKSPEYDFPRLHSEGNLIFSFHLVLIFSCLISAGSWQNSLPFPLHIMGWQEITRVCLPFADIPTQSQKLR